VGLSGAQRAFLGRLAARLDDGMDGEAIHLLVYELAAGFDGERPADLFRAIYLALLGKPRGPRAGRFLAVLGPAFCARRFREAAGGSG
jgi:lysyl-tRNA synthetase class I